ncbi:MAG: metal ABC transporter permease [Firmicutes bacterium]|nr:metal ABC transporter permease [Bacillota bacterium]
MTASVFDLFKLGVGPSSSHTMGPMSAAGLFVRRLRDSGKLPGVARVEIRLYASLALTGRGHATDRAVMLGLMGFVPADLDPDAGEAALAVFLSGGLAVAVVLISLARGFTVDLFGYLFGSIATVQPADLRVMAGLGAVTTAVVLGLYKDFFAVTLDEEAARTSGMPVGALNTLLTVLTALVVVLSMRVVGILLVSALLVLPALAAMRVATSFRGTVVAAVAFALAAVLLGLVAAFYLDLAAGGAIVLVALGLFGVASLVGRPRTGGASP